jgi:hypothetical protein
MHQYADTFCLALPSAHALEGAPAAAHIEDAAMSAITLADAISQYGRDAYLLTVGKGGPHTSHVSVTLDGDAIGCEIGASAARNIASEPNVSLFWPPSDPGGYAMIINGLASSTPNANGATLAQIKLTKSVFHRRGPKPADSDGPCASDCKPIARSA